MTDMRSIIEKTRPLFEMPFLTTSEEDFFLPDRAYNAKNAQRLMASDFHTILETDLVVLGDRQDGDAGEIFLFRKDQGLLTYFVRYEIAEVAPFGRSVTQVALWRSADPGLDNVTVKIFAEYLIPRFDAVISDDVQTRDGQRFWVGRMGSAARAGLTVGILIDGDFYPYESNQSLTEWLTGIDGWGDTEEHHSRLFVISKHGPRPAI